MQIVNNSTMKTDGKNFKQNWTMATTKNQMKIEKDIDQEYEIIKYALTYLLSNLEQDVIEDMSDYVDIDDPDKIESILQKIIDNY